VGYRVFRRYWESMETITVHNSSRRGWLIVLVGLVLVALALDLLVWNRLVADLANRVYQGEEVLEARERVWAGIMLAAGVILALWGVVSCIRPRPVMIVAPAGLHVALRGPLKPLDLLPWESIEAVLPQPVADDGSLLRSLTIVFHPTAGRPDLPHDPWGARWTGSRILRVLSSDWSVRAEVVSVVSNHYLTHMAERVEVSNSV